MRIDVSSDSFDPYHGYTRVLLQQGRPILDRDWNEQTSIVLHQLRAVTRAIYGRHGGPARGECGFIPTVEGKELHFRSGWYTVDGLILHYRPDPQDEPILRAADLENGKTHLIYLEAVEREVTAGEQKALLDTAMPGIDMAARGQVIWRVKHREWQAHNKCSDAIQSVNERYEKTPEKPPVIPFVGSMKDTLTELAKKSPNQLLRVEYHGDSLNEKSVWKCSSDNAFALFEIVDPQAATSTRSQAEIEEITIRLGVLDAHWAPAKFGVVELLTMENLQFDEPGELRTVTEIKPSDVKPFDAFDCQTITLDGSVKENVRFLRAWNSKIVLDVKGAERGDYWQFAVRGPVEAIVDISLKRPARVVAPLALLQKSDDGVPDIISRFQRIVGVPWREVDASIDLLAGPELPLSV
jgi:hypothetical protein